MKRMSLYACTAMLMFGLVSCGEMTQEVWINEDESGKVVVSIDAGEMIHQLESMLDAEEEIEEGEFQDFNIETGEVVDEDFGFFGEEIIDTSFSILDVMPDSIKAKVDDLSLFDIMKFSVEGNKEKGEMTMEIQVEYESEDQLEDFFQQMAKLDDSGQAAAQQEQLKGMFTNYSKDLSNGIVRIPNANSLSELEEQGILDEETKMQFDSIRQNLVVIEDVEGLSFFQSMVDFDVKTIYHVPGDIEYTNDDDAIIEGNTVTFSDNVWDQLMGTKSSDLEERVIKFKVK